MRKGFWLCHDKSGDFCTLCLISKGIEWAECGFTSCSINTLTEHSHFILAVKPSLLLQKKLCQAKLSPFLCSLQKTTAFKNSQSLNPAVQISGFLDHSINILKCAGEVHCMMDNETVNLNQQTNILSLAPACFFIMFQHFVVICSFHEPTGAQIAAWLSPITHPWVFILAKVSQGELVWGTGLEVTEI